MSPIMARCAPRGRLLAQRAARGKVAGFSSKPRNAPLLIRLLAAASHATTGPAHHGAVQSRRKPLPSHRLADQSRLKTKPSRATTIFDLFVKRNRSRIPCSAPPYSLLSRTGNFAHIIDSSPCFMRRHPACRAVRTKFPVISLLLKKICALTTHRQVRPALPRQPRIPQIRRQSEPGR